MRTTWIRRCRPHLEALEERAVPAVLLVDDNLVECPHADFTTIQAAVDAAGRNDTIRVCPGTYTEQVVIPDDKDGLTLRSERPFAARIQAPATLNDTRAIVHIDGADRVTVRGFHISGPADGLDFGIAVDNGGSATIRDNRISDVRETTLSGIQTGFGIFVGDETRATEATITGNEIVDYQKGGILVDGPRTEADVSGNVVRGVGTTAVIAQNGIQVSDGADADVHFNLVFGNRFADPNVALSSGILLFEAGDVRVFANASFANDLGIVVASTNEARVQNNAAFGNTDTGIYLFDAHDSLVQGNVASGNGLDGINVEASTGNVLRHNTANDNGRDGIHLESDARGNRIENNRMRDNDRFDAFDGSVGGGTAGTANFWRNNFGETENRPGLLRH
jgi:parallel beta-helix repeat protein